MNYAFLGAVVLLVVVTSIVVPAPMLSTFERRRRADEGETGGLMMQRALAYQMLVLLRALIQALLLVTSSLLAVVAFGWQWGSAAAIAVALLYSAISRPGWIHRPITRLYHRLEPSLFRFVHTYGRYLAWLQGAQPEPRPSKLGSRGELRHLIDTASPHIVSDDEKRLLHGGLDFASARVATCMTPRAAIQTIGRTELLGPLVLDDLHKKGHSRYPVTAGDLDHIVGVLQIDDVLAVDTTKKHTSYAETAMDPHVFYIHQNDQLRQALDTFMTTKSQLLIVVDDAKTTVGLVTLGDVLMMLFGNNPDA